MPAKGAIRVIGDVAKVDNVVVAGVVIVSVKIVEPGMDTGEHDVGRDAFRLCQRDDIRRK